MIMHATTQTNPLYIAHHQNTVQSYLLYCALTSVLSSKRERETDHEIKNIDDEDDDDKQQRQCAYDWNDDTIDVHVRRTATTTSCCNGNE